MIAIVLVLDLDSFGLRPTVLRIIPSSRVSCIYATRRTRNGITAIISSTLPSLPHVPPARQLSLGIWLYRVSRAWYLHLDTMTGLHPANNRNHIDLASHTLTHIGVGDGERKGIGDNRNRTGSDRVGQHTHRQQQSTPCRTSQEEFVCHIP